jgi:hypothetical protein
LADFNPKSEVGQDDLKQSAGREFVKLQRIYKYASAFFKASRLSNLRHLIPANFGIRA